jgi:hypothetical protein
MGNDVTLYGDLACYSKLMVVGNRCHKPTVKPSVYVVGNA